MRFKVFWSDRNATLRTGAILNSAVNVEYSIFLLNSLTSGYNKAHVARVALFWCIVNIGNILGAMGVSALFVYVQIFNEADEQRLGIILQDKLKVTMRDAMMHSSELMGDIWCRMLMMGLLGSLSCSSQQCWRIGSSATA